MSMANSRELVGKVAIIKDLPYKEATFGGFLGVIRTYQVLPMFVLYLLKTHYARISLIDSASQTTNIANVSLGKLNPFLIPLPPLEEQSQIVAEIDRLMARCDELEKLRADRSQKLLTVHTAALDNLLKAKDSSGFNTAWHFITQNFSELYSVKENVAQLRKTILQLAVMGKLVPQDPNDEPASELLRSIELEKQQLVKEGKIKQPKPLLEIQVEEMPYDVPKGWQWVRLGELALFSPQSKCCIVGRI
jgi:type I restriction enzyme, S subunit